MKENKTSSLSESIEDETNSFKKDWTSSPFRGLGGDSVFLPINLRISNRNILLIGGGKVAFHKATILYRFTSQITVLSPRFESGFETFPFEYQSKEYEWGDIDNFDLIYICTDQNELNREIKKECEKKGILASVCDAPALCDFTSPAIFRSGNLTISVATNATDVKRSIAIRNRIQELIEKGVLSIE